MRGLRSRYAWLPIAFATLLALLVSPVRAESRLLPAADGTVRALVVGIDKYAAKRWLKGAVADARDLAGSLRRLGVTDITVLIDEQATRAAIVSAMDRFVRDAKPNDLVFISFAGHGTRLPELVKNSKPDHMDEVYVLTRFDETIAKGARERIHGPEMKRWLLQLGKKGVDVLFVADTCHGGGLTRSADPRDQALSYREINVGALLQDDLAPEVTIADATADQSALPHVTFLAAADPNSKVPEVKIQGQATLRGALSYAVARALEGAADHSGKGVVTRRDLIEYASQAVYQFSETKQRIYYEPTRQGALDAVVFRDTGPPIAPVSPAGTGEPAALRVKVLGADPSTLAAVKPAVTPIVPTANDAEADFTWDAARQEAVYRGDVIARNITAADVPGVADRITAIRQIAVLAQSRPLMFRLLPNDRVHRAGETDLRLEASGLDGQYLLVFNIAGDGTVQYLFPLSNENPRIKGATWTLPIQVIKEPFGFDQVVAIASDVPLPGLEAAIRRHDGTRAAARIPRILVDHIGSNPRARIGIAGVVTAPRTD
jgi:hypothetical protein